MRRIFIIILAVIGLAPLTPIRNALALGISPLLFSYDLTAGDAASGTITLHNDSDFTRTYAPLVKNFVAADDESGTPQFVDDEATEHSLATWVKFSSNNITLAPSEERKISFTVQAPADVQSGSYFGALLFASSGRENGDTQVNEQVGVLLLVTVPGEAAEQASITDFAVNKNLLSALPATFTARIENEGELLVRPWGTIHITNIFGSERATLSFNPLGGHVLPDSTRRFDATWQSNEVASETPEIVKEWQNFAFGYYRATLVMNYGDVGQVTNATVGFWVIPWQIIVAVLTGLGLLTIVSRLIKKQK